MSKLLDKIKELNSDYGYESTWIINSVYLMENTETGNRFVIQLTDEGLDMRWLKTADELHSRDVEATVYE